MSPASPLATPSEIEGKYDFLDTPTIVPASVHQEMGAEVVKSLYKGPNDLIAVVPPNAPVAQLDRASAFEAESRRFESCRACQFFFVAIVALYLQK